MSALVFGKFYPLHMGHCNIISEALETHEDVTVLVLASRTETIPLKKRMEWIEDFFPEAEVIGGYDETPMGDTEEIWQHHIDAITEALSGDIPKVLIADEWYGAEAAKRLDCLYQPLDPGRNILPVSATQIRADVPGNWMMLPSNVRADLCKRIVIVGAESTGTTTLASDLATNLGTLWVQEYGRTYSQAKGPVDKWKWASREFDVIAREQIAQIDAALSLSGPIMICDTDALATSVWHERYIGYPHAELEYMARKHKPSLYFLTSPEGIEWEDDGVRDGKAIRQEMHDRFREALGDCGVPWFQVYGDRQARVKRARQVIDELEWKFGPSP